MYLIESQIIMMEVQSGSKSNWEVAFSSSRSKFEVDRPNMVDSAIVEIREYMTKGGLVKI